VFLSPMGRRVEGKKREKLESFEKGLEMEGKPAGRWIMLEKSI